MKVTKSIPAMALLLGLGLAQAGPAFEPALQSLEALAKAKDKSFKGIKEADIKRMRDEFSNKSQAAMSAAKSEYAILSRGKSDQQMDKLMWDRAEKAGVAQKIKSEIDAMGGPAKVMQQTDRVVAEFVREVLNDSRPQAKESLLETVVTALVMAQPAHARWGAARRGACYAFWFTISAGNATNIAYTSCDH